MSQAYIRIAKTPDVKKALADLHARYSLLTEAEIIRLLLSEAHKKEVEEKMEEEQKVREAFYHAMTFILNKISELDTSKYFL